MLRGGTRRRKSLGRCWPAAAGLHAARHDGASCRGGGAFVAAVDRQAGRARADAARGARAVVRTERQAALRV
eukprot:5169956-Prymnesium_polylepis.1